MKVNFNYQMKPNLATLVSVAMVIAGTATVARADLRSFTHTYEYATMPAHRTAVELWHTQTRATAPR